MIRIAENSERALISNMMQTYLAELSRYEDALVPVNGRYTYPYLDFYWRESDRIPYLLGQPEVASGFALVRQETDPVNGEPVTEMAEFFVDAAFRRKGLGSEAAKCLFAEHPGRWRVAVMQENRPAYAFWKNLLAEIDPGLSEQLPSRASNHQYVFHLYSFDARSSI